MASMKVGTDVVVYDGKKKDGIRDTPISHTL